MTKDELVSAIAKDTGQTKAAATAALEAAVTNIGSALAKGDSIRIPGLGTFGTKKVEARVGRNPKTSEAINIPASTRVSFSTSRSLKLAVNGQVEAAAPPAAKKAAKKAA